MLGFELTRMSSHNETHNIPIELDSIEIDLIKYVLDSGFTMTPISRLINTVKSCKYAVENNIPGDFVECGVWRGGNSILAKKVFEKLGSDKKVWMFDTFEGMTQPSGLDISAGSKEPAYSKYELNNRDSHNEWCYASLEDVKENILTSKLSLNGFNFVKGDVCQTLADKSNLPESICVLRLDTDWYKSTKAELDNLYPLLSKRGVLIIDDYGHWEGARKAVDEYFIDEEYKPFFNIVDYTGRMALKL
jgi:hypothetical protein